MVPEGIKIIGEGRCPWGCGIKILQHEKSPGIGFCPGCKKRVDFTGFNFTKSLVSEPVMSNLDDDMWRILRNAHCSHPQKKNKENPHVCVGTVSLAPSGMKLDCKLCGHFRKSPIPGKTKVTSFDKPKQKGSKNEQPDTLEV